MKRNTIKKLACSAIAGGMLLTCAASVSAFAASDEATAYVFIRDVDNKFIYEGEANDKTNTIAVKGDSDSKREENGTVTTEKITEDKKGVTVSLDLGSNTITPTDFALKLDGAEHAKNVKISDVKLKLDGKEVELSAEPKADVKDDEITLFIYRSSGDNLFEGSRDTNQFSKADITFTVENWYTDTEEASAEMIKPTEAEDETVGTIKPVEKAQDETVGTIKPVEDTVDPVKTGDPGLFGVISVMSTAVFAVAVSRKKK